MHAGYRDLAFGSQIGRDVTRVTQEHSPFGFAQGRQE